ncbi:MAG: ExbD/TolR family protein [Planctomycetota bacterium]|jgi:biopolymer transport protein ExbD
MSALFKHDRVQVHANLTPMIDVTFLLIVFFVLVSQIVEVENVDLDLPTPQEPASMLPGEESRVVINILPGPAGKASGYRMGGRLYAAGTQGIEGLTTVLADRYRENPALSVNLRADRATQYLWIEPVFQAVAAAARLSGRPEVTGRVNLVVTREN